MPKLDFGMIDAKDSEVVGIDGEGPKNAHNGHIMGEAEVMYLNGLLALQKAVSDKFNPKLIENKGGSNAGYDAMEAIAEAGLWQGTSNLWYA